MKANLANSLIIHTRLKLPKSRDNLTQLSNLPTGLPLSFSLLLRHELMQFLGRSTSLGQALGCSIRTCFLNYLQFSLSELLSFIQAVLLVLKYLRDSLITVRLWIGATFFVFENSDRCNFGLSFFCIAHDKGI